MDFERMGIEEMREYIDFLLWNFRAIDGFWYLCLEKEQGPDTANRFNEQVWSMLSGVTAKEAIRRFNITDKGVSGLVQAFKLFPWFRQIECRMEEKRDDVVVSITGCHQQIARLKRAMPEYDCKEMHRAAFPSFAGAADPSLSV